MSAPVGGAAAGAGGLANKEAAKALLKTGWLKMRSVLTNKSKIELLVEDATNLEPWGPTGQQMHEIAEASFDAEKFRQAWGVILRRFEVEPDQWRRIYKALLLTEHLLKNSSQHVVQTVMDATGVLEGLKQFKYLDEKNKDQGINVSNRAKELVLLLGNPDRIRAERAKAKSLKEKFKGASREDMVAAAPGWLSSFGSASGTGPAFGGGWANSSGGPSAGAGAAGAYAAAQRQQPLPADDDGHFGEEGPALGGEACPGKGYGSLPATASDAVAATAQRISSLRKAGLLEEEQHAGPGSSSSAGLASVGGPPVARPSSDACLAGAGGSGMPVSRSFDDLAAAPVGSSAQAHTAKPSLHELMARRAGPKKLQEVRVNPAIASTVAALRGGSSSSTAKPTAASSPNKLATAPVLLPPPPPATGTAAAAAEQVAPPARAGGAGGSESSALADLLGVPAPVPVPTTVLAAMAVASHSHGNSPLAPSSGCSSPWTANSPAQSGQMPGGGAFDAFVGAAGGHHDQQQQHHHAHSGSPAAASQGPPFASFSKLGAPASDAINLTATSTAANSGSPLALPAYLFAEPTPPPPAYSSATVWGAHVAGAPAVGPGPGHVAHPKAGGVVGAVAPKPAGDQLFADFSPFK